MSQDIEDTLNPRWVRVFALWGRVTWRWAGGGLVVPGGVDGELAEELAGGGVDDADVQVADEQDDVGPGVGAAGADVAEAAAGAEGDGAVAVGAVGADAVVSVSGPVAGDGFGACGAGSRRGGPVRQGLVRPAGAVLADEGAREGREPGEGGGLGGLGGEPFLEGLLESPGFALGLGVVWLPVLLGDAEAAELGFEGVAAALAAGQAGGEDHAVAGECRGRGPAGGHGGAEGGQDDGAGDPVVRGDGQGDPVSTGHLADRALPGSNGGKDKTGP
jgi:hypothetical protein